MRLQGSNGPEIRAFLADEMLGRLSRTLRLLGFDTEYVKGVEDAALLARADADGRALLTRDTQLAERARARGLACVLVRAIEHEAQAREVLAALALVPDPARLMSRCSACNAELRPARDDEAAAAPEGARPPFWRCDGCGKLYWEGSHGPRIRKMAERLGR